MGIVYGQCNQFIYQICLNYVILKNEICIIFKRFHVSLIVKFWQRPTRTHRYHLPISPLPIEIKLPGQRAADADIVLRVALLLDADIASTPRYHDDLPVPRRPALLGVLPLYHVALGAVPLADAAVILLGGGVHHPVTAHFLKQETHSRVY